MGLLWQTVIQQSQSKYQVFILTYISVRYILASERLPYANAIEHSINQMYILGFHLLTVVPTVPIGLSCELSTLLPHIRVPKFRKRSFPSLSLQVPETAFHTRRIESGNFTTSSNNQRYGKCSFSSRVLMDSDREYQPQSRFVHRYSTIDERSQGEHCSSTERNFKGNKDK